MVEQIQAKFFSKENISGLNKILQQQTNNQNLGRDAKQELITLLVKNMKIIFKQIDISKINSNNINTIFEQFKNHSLKNTINELNLLNKPNSTSELKFNRDFNSNPTNGNKLMDRPTATKQTESINTKNSFTNFNNNNYEASLDQAFKPIVENNNEGSSFNNYTNGRNKDDIKSLMSNVQQSRQQELNSRNQRPPTPEFLKPIKTSNKEETQLPVNNNNNSLKVPTNTKLDFKSSTSDQFNDGFQGLSNDVSGDLFSLDNIDKPLIEQEMVEDNSSFEDRLKRLQSDRGSLVVNGNNDGKIDFTSEKFPNSDIGDNSFKNDIKRQDMNRQEIQRQEIPRSELKRQEIQRQDAQKQELKRPEVQRQEIPRTDLNRQEIPRTELKRPEVQRQEIPRTELNRQEIPRSNKQKNNISIQETMNNSIKKATDKPNSKINELKDIMMNMNIDVKSDNLKLKELELENKELKKKIEYENNKILEIKKQIANEFYLLEVKNNEYSEKISELEIQEIEFMRKNNELNQMLIKYDYLFKTSYLQFEVSDINNSSSYKWKFQKPINNVVAIKLMSYSIPSCRYNINRYNKRLSLRIDDNILDFELDEGKYSIEDVISILNNKLSKNNIIISLNNQDNVIIESENNFDILETDMSKDIFGFISECINQNKYISNNIIDLRINHKLYLYLENLSDSPFGILYFNGQSDSQFKFKEGFDLEYIDISFKDSKGRDYDFNNLKHSLSFLIEQIN